MKVAVKTVSSSSGHGVRGIGYYTQSLIEGLKRRSDMELVEFVEYVPRDVDVVHFPFFDLYKRSLKVGNVATVVTIHDVTALEFISHYPVGVKARLANFFQMRELKKVGRVITDSNASRAGIVKFLKVNKSRIDVIHLAAGEEFRVVKDKESLKQIREKFSLPEKFALYIGDVNWNKNLLGIARACVNVGLELVLVGKAFEQNKVSLHKELESYNLFLTEYAGNALIHRLGFLETDDLVGVLNLATVCMLVSFSEGFGLSILQAQQSGAAVVTSNVSSMPEVAGNGAILVDPYKVEDISGALRAVSVNARLRKDLIRRGFENVKKFSWDRTIEETVDSYRRVLRDEKS